MQVLKPTAVRNFASNVINSGDILNVRRNFNHSSEALKVQVGGHHYKDCGYTAC